MLRGDALDNGIKIGRDLFRITGIVHRRGEGDWSVSVKRTGLEGWHCLVKDTTPVVQEERDALLSDVVLILVTRENADKRATNAG